MPQQDLSQEPDFDGSLDSLDDHDPLTEEVPSTTPLQTDTHQLPAASAPSLHTRPRSTRITSRPYKLADYHIYLASQDPDHCMALLTNSTSEVQINDALRDLEWRAAMQVELDAHQRNQTWDLAPLPPGEKVDQLGAKKFKARVVARGNEQREGKGWT